MDRATDVHAFLSSEDISSSTPTSAIYIGGFHEAQLLIKLSACSGTVEFTLECSEASDGDFYTHPDFNIPLQFTAAASKMRCVSCLGKYVRLAYTVSSSGSATVDEAQLVRKT